MEEKTEKERDRERNIEEESERDNEGEKRHALDLSNTQEIMIYIVKKV